MTPLRLLLVDDDAVDREAVRRTLRAAGIEASVTEAGGREEALAAVRGGAFDCVLLDYVLPGTDGLATLAELREAGLEAPVIALTGYADHETAVAMMKAGAVDYVNKGTLTAEGLEKSLRHARRTAAAERERRELLAREQAARLEAQAANRAKDEFLATLSHELRTPLNSILGWTRLLTSGSLDAAGSRRALEVIERNVILQAKLIDDLLDISRVVTGKLTIEREPVSLAGVVAAVVESHRPAAAAADVALEYQADVPEQPVIGEAARLQQVITNLLSNAIKFTPAGGRVDVSLTFTDRHARIVVTDTGVGIVPEFLPHVFEQFRQADASTTRRRGGLGLGLAIVLRIVELHGGTVRAESSGPGCGAAFTVTLPLGKSPVVEARAAPLAYPDLRGTSVLVVDDDEDGRELVALLLGNCGARVRTAASVAQALKLAVEERPDLLLSDIAMPGEDGYHLIRRLRETVQGLIPAVALSAAAAPEDRARALEAGFCVHLAKPVHAPDLFAALSRLRAADMGAADAPASRVAER